MTAFDLVSFALFIGLDVGKSEHHATALTGSGERVYDKALPNDESKLRSLLGELTSAHGAALLVVDQPATIGALPVAVARAVEGVEVAYLPGLTMRRMADLHAGSAKTSRRRGSQLLPTPLQSPSRFSRDRPWAMRVRCSATTCTGEGQALFDVGLSKGVLNV